MSVDQAAERVVLTIKGREIASRLRKHELNNTVMRGEISKAQNVRIIKKQKTRTGRVFHYQQSLAAQTTVFIAIVRVADN